MCVLSGGKHCHWVLKYIAKDLQNTQRHAWNREHFLTQHWAVCHLQYCPPLTKSQADSSSSRTVRPACTLATDNPIPYVYEPLSDTRQTDLFPKWERPARKIRRNNSYKIQNHTETPPRETQPLMQMNANIKCHQDCCLIVIALYND